MIWALSIAVGFLAAIVGSLSLPARRAWSRLAWGICFVAVALFPCVLRPGTLERFTASLLSICWLVKLFDLQRSQDDLVAAIPSSQLPTWLMNPFWLVSRRIPPPKDSHDNLRILAVKLFQSLVCVSLTIVVFQQSWSELPFLLEHCLKALATYGTVVSAAGLAAALWRATGALALEPMLTPWMATTPAEFWRRWNRPAQSFYEEHVFRRCGGIRRPVRATLATFLVSGLVHEFVFGIATGRPQGVQLAFFLIQGIAALATARWKPRGAMRYVGQGMTISFNLLTSILFFESVNEVVPFYQPRNTL